MGDLSSIVRVLREQGFSREERRLIIDDPVFEQEVFWQQQELIKDSNSAFYEQQDVPGINNYSHGLIRVNTNPYANILEAGKKIFTETLDNIMQSILSMSSSPIKMGILALSVTAAGAYFLTPKAAHAQTTTIYVDDSNTGIEDGSQAHPYNTISEGINAIVSGGTIRVAAGQYNERLVIEKNLNLIGENPATTIINGLIAPSPEESFVLFLYKGKHLVNGFTFKSESLNWGIFDATDAEISNNIFLGNKIGIQINLDYNSKIVNNTFYNNGSSIMVLGNSTNRASATVKNNILVGSNVYGGLRANPFSSVTFQYNCLYNNNPNFFDFTPSASDIGNIFTDPKFVNAAGGDFRLATGSPAINAGDPAILDKDNSRSDMGAYGGPGTIGSGTTPPPPPPPPTPTDVIPPYIKSFFPAQEYDVPLNTDIKFILADDGTGIDISSIIMNINFKEVIPIVQQLANGDVSVSYPTSKGIEWITSQYWKEIFTLRQRQRVSVDITARDRASSPNEFKGYERFWIEPFDFSDYNITFRLRVIGKSSLQALDFQYGRAEKLEFTAKLYGNDNPLQPIQEFRATADGDFGFKFDNIEQISRWDIATNQRVSTLNPGLIEIVRDNGYVRRNDANISTPTPNWGRKGDIVSKLTIDYPLDYFEENKRIIITGAVFEQNFRIDKDGNYDHRSITSIVPNRNNDNRFIENDDLNLNKGSLLLVPGLNNKAGYWGILPDLLTEEGYNVFELNYYPNDGKIDISAAMIELCLSPAVGLGLNSSNRYGDFDLITHSTGGLSARTYMKGLENYAEIESYYSLEARDAVKGVLMLGTPNHGSYAAARLAHGNLSEGFLNSLVSFFGDINPEGEAYRDLSPGSPLLIKLNQILPDPAVKYFVIAGTKDINLLNLFHNEEAGSQDGVVSVKSASLLDQGVSLGLTDFNHIELSGRGLERGSEKLRKLADIIEMFHNGATYEQMKSKGLLKELIPSSRNPLIPFNDPLLDRGALQAMFYAKDGKPITLPISIYNPQANNLPVPTLKFNPESNVHYFYYEGNDAFYGSGLSLPANTTFQLLSGLNSIGNVSVRPMQTKFIEFRTDIDQNTIPNTEANITMSDITINDNRLPINYEQNNSFLRTVWQQVLEAAKLGIPEGEEGISTDVDINLKFTGDIEKITKVTGYFSSLSGYVTPSFNLEMKGDQYFVRARFKNLTKLGLKTAISAMNNLVAESPIEGIASSPIITLDSVVVNLTTGRKPFALKRTLPRFEKSIDTWMDKAYSNGLLGNYSSFAFGSPIEFIVEGPGGKLGRENGQEFNQIPYSYFNQDSDPKVAFIFGDGPYNLRLKATNSGNFSLSVYNGRVNAPLDSVSYVAIPVQRNQTANLQIGANATNDTLNVYNQNGERMFFITPGDLPVPTGDESVSKGAALPREYSLEQNYPNPFNPSTTVSYSLPDNGVVPVKLDIYNLRGAKVKTLVDRQQAAGNYQLQWDGTDDSGKMLGSGVYFYRLHAGEFVQTRKMVLVK